MGDVWEKGERNVVVRDLGERVPRFGGLNSLECATLWLKSGERATFWGLKVESEPLFGRKGDVRCQNTKAFSYLCHRDVHPPTRPRVDIRRQALVEGKKMPVIHRENGV